jgi:hypothetical protein
MSRRDSAIKVANELNASDGGLPAIDELLAEVAKTRVGKPNHVENLFRTMAILPDGVSPSEEEDDLDDFNWSRSEADVGLDGPAFDPLASEIYSTNQIALQSNLEAIQYQLGLGIRTFFSEVKIESVKLDNDIVYIRLAGNSNVYRHPLRERDYA